MLKTDGQAGRQAGRQAGKEAGREAGRQASCSGRLAGEKAARRDTEPGAWGSRTRTLAGWHGREFFEN
jgi:hypothetical protein